MGATTFKKACRRHNIKHWPQRQYNSLNKLLKDLSGHPCCKEPAATAAERDRAGQGMQMQVRDGIATETWLFPTHGSS
jgi:hypothetical protein